MEQRSSYRVYATVVLFNASTLLLLIFLQYLLIFAVPLAMSTKATTAEKINITFHFLREAWLNVCVEVVLGLTFLYFINRRLVPLLKTNMTIIAIDLLILIAADICLPLLV